MGTLYKRGKTWHCEYTDWDGKRVRRSTKTKVKSNASDILTKWENDANRRRVGLIISPDATLADLVSEYIKYLGNNGDKHIDLTKSRLDRVINANEWKRPGEITQLAVETTVRNLNVIGKKRVETDKRLSLRTQNHYLACLKSFTKWLTQVRRAIAVDPLVSVKKPSFDKDRRLVRRFLLPEEWTWLSLTENAVLYETAIQTGFRSRELMSIRPEHLQDDHIFLPARFTKNKQDARQYITSKLRAKLEGALPFSVPDEERLAVLLRADLAVARELLLQSLPGDDEAKVKAAGHLMLPKNALGQVLDFHGLRHTCGAWLASAGVNVKVIQKVMRHSSITLTLDTYGHLLPCAEQDAVKEFNKIL